MADPFLSQITMLPFNWPPRGYSLCNGQSLPIAQNQALFSLIGTQFGGDGRTTFNLPDLRGRAPVHPDDSGIIQPGFQAGQEIVTLKLSELAMHTHMFQATTTVADKTNSLGTVLAEGKNSKNKDTPGPDSPLYCNITQNLVQLSAETLSIVGGNGYHNNMQPSVVISFCIAIEGVFPSRN